MRFQEENISVERSTFSQISLVYPALRRAIKKQERQASKLYMTFTELGSGLAPGCKGELEIDLS